MSRRKMDSTDDFRPLDAPTGGGLPVQPILERKSVFERLGARRGGGSSGPSIDDSDLRYRMSRKRRANDSDPESPTNQTPLSPPMSTTHRHTSGGKSDSKSSDDKYDTKVKSLVLTPTTSSVTTNRRSESPSHKWPTNVSQSVSSSSSMSKRSKNKSSGKYGAEDVDLVDCEDLEKKRLELQKQLQSLETTNDSGADTDQQKSAANSSVTANPLAPTVVVSKPDRSRSSSLISSESDSYSSSLKSVTKTESSENSDKKALKSTATKSMDNSSKPTKDSKSKTSDSKTRSHVSSSISVKSGTHLVEESSSRSKSSEVKLDRHGNVRISLDEQERQKRLRAERFGHNNDKSKTSDSKRKKSPRDSSRHSTEPRIVVSRDHSYSPSSKKSKDLSSELHVVSDAVKVDKNNDTKRDRNSRSSVQSNKYESLSPRSRSRERKDTTTGRHEDNRSKNSRNYLDTNSAASLRERHSSHYSDNTSADRRSGRTGRRGDHNRSRDQSPTHSSLSKLSRDRESSIGSDFSRRSKSERMSTKSFDTSVHNKSNNDLKTSNETKAGDLIIEDRLSSISADSSIPDIPDLDSPHNGSKTSAETDKKPKNLSPNRRKSNTKSDYESVDNFSDWSEGEDDILLKKDGFETLDEVCNISDNSMGKESWTGKSSHSKSKRDSHSSHSTAANKDDALEAISDDELDAIIGDSDPNDSTVDTKTSKANRQVLDALDIDWGSLVTEPKPKSEFIPGSARKRFSAANVLMRIGFSQALAGQQMTHKLINFCKSELKEEFVPFRHPMATVHSVLSERIRERLQLFGADSTPATVLSGRKDSQIRKMLNKSNCKLIDNCLTTTTSALNQTPTTSQSIPTITTTPPVNELSVSSTNPIATTVTDIECF